MFSALAFYSDGLSSNPADAQSLKCKMLFQNNENKNKKRSELAHFLHVNEVRPQGAIFVAEKNPKCLILG